jgi:putative hydrolase of the HAD superfamily
MSLALPIRGIVFDLDGTLYRDDGEAMAAAYLDAGSRAAVDLHPALTIEEARLIADSSFERYGLYATGFEARGIDPRDFHFRFHELLDVAVIEPIEGLAAALDTCGTANFVLLTHASRHWAEHAIGRLGLARHFPSKRILAYEDFGFSAKSIHPLPFQMAMAGLGTDAAETAVIEDRSRNLVVPHRLGMRTYLVNYRLPEALRSAYAHGERTSVVEVLADIRIHNARALKSEIPA